MRERGRLRGLLSVLVLALTIASTASAQAPLGGGAGNPHGAMPNRGRGPMGSYIPPSDRIEPDMAVPVGAVDVVVVNADEQPVEGAEVELLVTHQSITLGDSREHLVTKSDAQGKATFRKLSFGTGHSYVLRSKRQGATYDAGPFGLTDQQGISAVLHVFDASSSLEDSLIFTQSTVVFSVKDDVLVVEQRVDLANPSPVSWNADVEIPLPAGFKAFTIPDDMTPSMIPGDTGARLLGTVPPGGAQIVFRYHVPLENKETQALALVMPPRSAFVRVVAEASKKMGLRVEGFEEPIRQKDRNGRGMLMAQRRWKPADGEFISKVRVHISGLPTRPWGAWVAVGLSVLALSGALAYIGTRKRGAALPADSLADLVEAREALLADIIELERLHVSGGIGPRSYARTRQAMVDALSRIVTKLRESGVEDEPAPSDPGSSDPDGEPQTKSSGGKGRGAGKSKKKKVREARPRPVADSH